MTLPTPVIATRRIASAMPATLACLMSLAVVSTASGAPTTPSGERFYERVTPAFKNGAVWGHAINNASAELTERNSFPLVARNGDRILGESTMPPAETASNAFLNRYTMTRVPGEGWTSRVVDPGLRTQVVMDQALSFYGASADLRYVALLSRVNLDPRDTDGSPFSSGYDIYGYVPDDPAAGHSLLSCPPAPAAPCADGTSVVLPSDRAVSMVSADGRVTVFETTEPLTATADGSMQVYARVGDEVRHVSRPLDAVPPGATQVGFDPSLTQEDTSAPDGGPNVAGRLGGWPNPISRDGSRIFFAAPWYGNESRVYVRIGDERTLEVSRARGGSGAAQMVKFRGASVTGNRALVTTQQALLPPAGADSASIDPNAVEDLYLWTYDEANDPGNDSPDALTRISGLTQIGEGPAVDGQTGLSMAGMSDDLTRVYFTTRETVAPESPAEANLYVAELPDGAPRSGRVRFIATLHTQVLGQEGLEYGYGGCLNGRNVGSLTPVSVSTCAAASPDGRYLAFQSRMPLTGDDRDTNGVGVCAPPVAAPMPSYCREDVYVYDLADGSLDLASKGAAPVVADGQFDAVFEVNLDNLSILDNGMVFFSTKEALVAGDSNGMGDVYEFQDGDLDLVSAGTGDNNSLFVGAGEDGTNVIFLTVDDLRDDEDTASDYYNARLGDTFPDTRRDCALGQDGCQGPGSSGSGISPPTTGGGGGGNVATPLRIRLSRAGLSTLARRRAARSGVVTIKAVVPKAGRLTAIAKTRLRAGRGVVTVARSAVRARRAGPVTVRLRLRPAARRHLASGRRLRLSVGITMSGSRPGRLTLALERRGR